MTTFYIVQQSTVWSNG